MAEKKKEEAGDLYDKDLDRRVDDILKEWLGMHSKEQQDDRSTDMTNKTDLYNNITRDYLGEEIHGKDEEGQPKKRSIRVGKDLTTARIHAQKLLYRIAKKAIEHELGKKAAEAYTTHEQIEEYLASRIGKPYDEIVDDLIKPTDVLKDETVQGHLGRLAQITHKDGKQVARLIRHLAKRENFDFVEDEANKMLAKTGYEFDNALVSKQPELMLESLGIYLREGTLPSSYADAATHLKKKKTKG